MTVVLDGFPLNAELCLKLGRRLGQTDREQSLCPRVGQLELAAPDHAPFGAAIGHVVCVRSEE